MQNIKKIIFFSMLIFFVQICYYVPTNAIGQSVGVEFAQQIAPALEKSSAEIAKGCAEFGSQFGLETVQAIGNGIMTAATTAKSAVIATGASIKSVAAATAATAKSTAIAAASAPAATYIVVGAAVIVISYGGYQVYRHYNPTQEQIAAALKVQAEIEKHNADIARFKADGAKSKAEEAKYQASMMKAQAAAEAFHRNLIIKQREQEFKTALLLNKTAARNANGIPFGCQKEALHLAMAGGSKKVEKIVAAFNNYTSASQAA